MSINTPSSGASSTATPKKTHALALKKPALGNLSACDDYAREAFKISTKPYKTLAYIWTRFLIRSYLFSEQPTKQYTGWKIQEAFCKNEGGEL